MSAGPRRRAYHESGVKRGFDVVVATLAIVILLPFLGLVALLIGVLMGRPVFFVQERVGRSGRPFRLVKFRTMRPGDGRGAEITAGGDPRVTRLGRWLRASKLDELPQLLNVLRGEMSVVGPRPEMPRYVALYTEEQRRVLRARPGLTDPASIRFRDEETRLARVEAARRERVYVEELLPEKLRLNLDYLERCSFGSDLGVIASTALAIVRPGNA